MRIFYICVLLVLFTANLCQAQDVIVALEAKIDSLKAVLETTPEKDTARFEILNELALELFDYGDAEGFKLRAEEYRALALELESEERIRHYYIRVMNDIRFSDTLLYEQRSAEGEAFFKESKDTIGLVNIYFDRSIYYFDILLDNERSHELLQESLKLSNKIKYTKILPEIWLSIGLFFANTDDDEKAVEYFNKTISSKDAQIYNKAYALNEKANLLLKNESYDSVEYFLKETLELTKEDSDLLGIQFAYASLGDFHFQQGNIASAKEYYRKVEPLAAINQCDCTPLATTYRKIGVAHLEQNELDSALFYIHKSIKQVELEVGSKVRGISYANLEAYNLLKDVYKSQKQYDSAFFYLDKFHALNNRADELALETASEELSVQYETEQKDQEISSLSSEKELLELRSRTYLFGMLGIGIAGIISLFFFLRLRAKNRLIQSQKATLEQLNFTKDRIFAIIGHDMRKPALAFRGIGKKVNYLLKKQDYATLNALGNEIEKDALSLNKLTDNLLNWALTQKDVMPYNPKLLAVAPLVKEVLMIFNLLAKEKQIHLVSDIPESLKVNADKNALLTIVRNLIDNAIKYTPKGGEVRVQATQKGEQILLQVEDTGVGMSKEKLNDIFLLREGKSEVGTAGETGTGLGLHLIHELVKLNKGAIKVVSQVGKGTRFDVILPIL